MVYAYLGVPLGICSLLYSHLGEQVNNVRMVVSPLWCGPGNIHGFILDGQGKANAQTLTEPTNGGFDRLRSVKPCLQFDEETKSLA